MKVHSTSPDALIWRFSTAQLAGMLITAIMLTVSVVIWVESRYNGLLTADHEQTVELKSIEKDIKTKFAHAWMDWDQERFVNRLVDDNRNLQHSDGSAPGLKANFESRQPVSR